MPLIGSDGGFQADNRGGLIDELGNTVVSSRTTFGASPLGVAARTQALYGIPNANFNLTPPEPADPIVANQNDLPYWSIENLSDGQITATTVFDATTQTWGVELNPGTAASGSTLSLTTRSYLITDDNLALRQKAQAVLSKSGTAAVSTQWNLTLSAIYYDSTDTALSTAIIGTALDTGTWTSLAGTTTPGGSAINAAAQYVDLTFTLTTTAAVTGTAKATIKSLLLTTSTPGAGGGLLITETFTSNTTWTRPTGVDYLVAAIGCGGGGGGGGGALRTRVTGAAGSGGGAAGNWFIIRDLYVGNLSTISLGIGAGGTGGTAQTFTKAVGGTGTAAIAGAAGAAGGATTIGSLITVNGGGGGAGASGTASTTGAAGGGAGGTALCTIYIGTDVIGGGGGNGGADKANGVAGNQGNFSNYTAIPYSVPAATGSDGAASTGTGATNSGGLAGAGTGANGTGWIGGGGGAGGPGATSTPVIGNGGDGRRGGGGAGASRAIYLSVATTGVTGTAGNGGNAGGNAGAGGGAGGSLAQGDGSSTVYNNSSFTFASGAGGNGAGGFVTIVYIA